MKDKQCTKDGDCEHKLGGGRFYYCLAPDSIDCHYAEPVDEEVIAEVQIQGVEKHCHTKKHKYHVFVPWFWNHPYDKICTICSHDAALESGSGLPLCDCCAQDWHEWNVERGVIYNSSGKNIWMQEFELFRKAQQGG